MKKKFFVILFLSLLGFLLLFVIYLSVVFFNAKNKVSSVMIPLEASRHENEPQESMNVLLEKDSIIYREDFESYFLFSQEVEQEINFNDSFEVLTKNKNQLLLKKDLNLSPLLKNDCQDLFCFQNRVNFTELPPIIWKGLIGIEDLRYLEHSGVDLISIFRAIIVDIKNWGLVQGGSTLTQQLVKNLFFSNEKTLFRKFHEIIYSIYLENFMTKDQILTAYFNETYWGVMQGVKVKGIYAASLFYFQKRPKDLAPFESVILISLLRGPAFYSPFYHLDRLESRSKYILQKLIDSNLISKIYEKDMWTHEDFLKWKLKLDKLNETSPYLEIWKVINTYKENYLNPYEVFVFNKVVDRVRKKINLRKDDLNDLPFTVKAVIGDIKDNTNLFKYYSKVERNLEKGIVNERHQIGSIVKPVLYSIYHRLGISYEANIPTFKYTKKLKSGIWEPKESQTVIEDEVTVLNALKRSLNWPTLRIAEDLGFNNVEKYLKEYFKDLKTPLEEFPAQLLGAMESSLYEVFLSYQKLFIDECAYQDEELKQQNLFILLSNPEISTIRRYLNKEMKDFSFFGKTGTTNLGVDNWYLAYNGQELFVIWFGIEEKYLVTKDLKIYGSQTSFDIFQDFVTHRGKRFPDFGEFFIKKSCEGLQKKRTDSIFRAY